MCLVRVVHAADELAQVEHSHEGKDAEEMLVSPRDLETTTIVPTARPSANHRRPVCGKDGLHEHHERIQRANPAWLLDLLRQLPGAAAEDARAAGQPQTGDGGAPVRLAELKACVHRLGPWWI